MYEPPFEHVFLSESFTGILSVYVWRTMNGSAWRVQDWGGNEKWHSSRCFAFFSFYAGKDILMVCVTSVRSMKNENGSLTSDATNFRALKVIFTPFMFG